MSIDQILADPVSSKKRKQTFDDSNDTDLRPTKRSRTENAFLLASARDLKFRTKLKELINNPTNKKKTFKSIGLCRELCLSAKKVNWTIPTKIQKEAIPQALLGQDIIALAETGSGKTGAFALPAIQSLLNHPIAYHTLVLSPTRELALQIHSEFESLGADIGLKTITIIGGVDRVKQAMKLQKRPHVIIGTPGRILDHLLNCKGFNLVNLKYLIMDEADRILNSDFSAAIEQIIKMIRKSKHEFAERMQTQMNASDASANNEKNNEITQTYTNYQTLLFSATMTKKVERLEKACLREENMVKIEVSNKYQTVSSLAQFYLFIPAKHKLCYISYLLNNIMNDRSCIVFTNTKRSCHHLSLVLHNLNLTVIPLHGEMTQYERMGAIEKFRSGNKSILVATDVAARGLDIPIVTVIINYDLPIHSKDYIHRVGRTARAGKKGKALNLVTQYDVEIFQRIETLIKLRMTDFSASIDKSEVMGMLERVMKADRVALMQIKEHKDEIKDKIKELSRRKRSKNHNKMNNNNIDNDAFKHADDSDDEGQFVMDDFDYDYNGGKGDRMIGPKQGRTNNQERMNYKKGAKKDHDRMMNNKNKRGRKGSKRGRNIRRAQSFDSMKDFKKSYKF